ncbi:hypothetical protein AY509_11040 [Corynebacterium diphtheriae bv. mitis]|nr:hypothetical protein AY507_06475 [Corynebacterium diphtheriae bv. mitis]OWN79087.1 hypothetical protein AY509_11040 [Corynebacterium diphtheriae bv. mitis]
MSRPPLFGPSPFSRLLELKNTKTAGRDFFAEMPTLGFRSLELKFLDSYSWIRAGARPTPHSNIAGG